MNWISRAVILIVLFFALLPLARADSANWKHLSPLLAQSAPVGEAGEFVPSNGKPVIVTFFASWCPPCTDEFGHLNSLAASEASGDVQIIGVNVFEDFGGVKNPERMKHFLERTDPQFVMVKGSAEILEAFGNIDRIPTGVVFGNSGDEVWRFVHERDAEKTHATSEDLIGALKLAKTGNFQKS
ncbi:MAG: redoxin family protein [Hyphomicrobiales bacterium]|nr:redoxin family protein [Hyphomicrobiales bacterium]MCP5002136.1 redoxin family protein [Hyphomicrobiales bacterium]